MIKSEKLTVENSILGRSYPIQNLVFNKKFGMLADAGATLQLAESPGSPIDSESVFDFASSVIDGITDKTGPEPNFDVTIESGSSGRINFKGIVVGGSVSISASGNLMLRVRALERAKLMEAMSLTVYRPKDADFSASDGSRHSEVKYPYAAAGGDGSISDRILNMYEEAKNNNRTDDSHPLAEAYRNQMSVNERLEEVFKETLENSETNPEWLQNLNSDASLKLNNAISKILFVSRGDLWSSLMALMNRVSMAYTGGISGPGKFTEIKIKDAESGGENLAADPASDVGYTLSANRSFALGKVLAVGSERNYVRYSAFAGSGSDDVHMAGEFPEQDPEPENGKIAVFRAPSYFTLGENLKKEGHDEFEGDSRDEMKNKADEMKEESRKKNSNAEKISGLINDWAENQYLKLRTQSLFARVSKPFVADELELDSPVSVNDSKGLLTSLKYSVQISNESADAETVYGVGYLQ